MAPGGSNLRTRIEARGPKVRFAGRNCSMSRRAPLCAPFPRRALNEPLMRAALLVVSTGSRGRRLGFGLEPDVERFPDLPLGEIGRQQAEHGELPVAEILLIRRSRRATWQVAEPVLDSRHKLRQHARVGATPRPRRVSGRWDGRADTEKIKPGGGGCNPGEPFGTPLETGRPGAGLTVSEAPASAGRPPRVPPRISVRLSAVPAVDQGVRGVLLRLRE